MSPARAEVSRLRLRYNYDPARHLPWFLPAAVLLLAGLVRCGVLLAAPDNLAADPDGYRMVAENLIAHGVLGHGDVPTAKRPPLYPLLLAVCFALGPWTRAAVGILHVGMGVATAWLVLRLGRRAGLGSGAAVAALLVACDPILLWHSTLVMTETAAALLSTAALLALAALPERPTPLRAAATGAVLGLAGLCRPELLLFGAAAIAVAGFARRTRASSLGTAAGLAVGACLVVAPWAVRNWVQFGRPVITTTHGGYTVFLANNRDYYRHLRERGWREVWQADSFHVRWRTLCNPGGPHPHDELASDAAAYCGAFQDIAEDPGMFLASSGVRVGTFWQLVPHRLPDGGGPMGSVRRTLIGAWYAVEFVLAGIGLWAVFRLRQGGPGLRAALAWGALLACSVTAVHAVYWTNMRMRSPLTAWVALGAAAGAVWLWESVSRRKWLEGNDLQNEGPG